MGNLVEIERGLRELLNELEVISQTFEDVTDTDVREAISEVLSYHFVWGQPLERYPTSYRMLNREGDVLVAKAMNRFLEGTSEAIRKVALGRPRLELLQDGGVRSRSGERYDLFMGHLDEPRALKPLPQSLFKRNDP